MSSEDESSDEHQQSDSIEDKRRKNVLDNQKFLQSLHLINVRDDLKSTVNSATTRHKSSRKKHIDPSEVRRSSRIRTMPQTDYNNQSTDNEENIIISTDGSSNEEDEDELTYAFTSKFDEDWKPLHPEKPVPIKHLRPVRKGAKRSSGGVKIYHPNTGLEAATVISKERPQRAHVLKKMNVAISSSEEEDD